MSLVTRHPLLATPSLLLALGFAFLAALPLFGNPGYLNTRGIGDSPNLLFRVHQLLAAFSGGEFPARWMPDAAYGYGMPYFTYYASASTHLAALLKAYGFSYVNAIKLTQLLALVVAAGGMYGWLRSTRLTRACSSLASIAYSFAPFHLVNLYIRGDSLAELWAMALYPLVLWAAQRCCERMSFIRAFGLALTVATLICTHNISALNFMPFVIAYLILKHRVRGEYRANRFSVLSVLKPVWRIGVALIWGVALADFFWLPALGETAFVQLGDLTQGYFFYGHHFRNADLIQSSLLFDYEANPFSMGLAQTVLAAFGLGAMVWRAVRRRAWTPLNTFTVLGLALSTLMITPLSQSLWEAVPLLAYTQFPWRFLSIQALFTALLIGELEIGEFSNSPILRSLVLFCACAALSLSVLLPLRLTFFPLSDSDVTAERLNLYEYFTTAIGNTVNGEYLPQAVKPRPFTSAALLGREPQAKVLSGQAVGRRLGKLGARELWYFEIQGDIPATIAIPTHYWPGWEAESDGEPVPLRATPGLGWITFELPPSAHSVTFRVGRTPLRLWAEVFSALALVTPIGIFLYRRARRERGDFFSIAILRAPLRPRALAVVVAALVLGAVVLRMWPNSPISNSPLTADFDMLAYPHRDVVRFGEAGELRGVTYSAKRLQRGETLIVQTEWTLRRNVEATFRLATPLRDSALPLPFTTVTITGAQAEAALTIPDTLPPGLYFVTVELHDKCCVYPALTAGGRARGLVYLAPVIVDDGETIATPQPAQTDLGALRLVRGEVAFAAGDELTAQLTWQATADVLRNYALALRVRDAAGNDWGSGGDVQPAHGFYPTALWRPGEIITDSVRVTLAGPGEPPGAYQLAVTVYDASTLQSFGTANLPFALNRRHPREGRAAQFTLTPNLAIEKVEFPAQVMQGEAVPLAVTWLTGQQPNSKYRARWSIDGPPGRLYTTDLAPGSPTDRWPLDAYLIGRVRLPISNDLAPGEYALSVQLIDEAGNAVGNAANVGTLNVQGRARDFAVPPVRTAVSATFDGQLKLVGYDSTQTNSELKLQLVWQALTQPRGDYKYFVHLFNPADEFVATQADAVPRNFTYPTNLWIKDEVVTEAVSLALSGVPAGTYRLAVGWYDPVTPDLARLPAFDANGAPLENGRVILPLTVSVE